VSRGSALSTSLIGVVVGLSAEAQIARRLSNNVLCSGGRADVAARHARTLIEGGATSLMSVGIAGGLAPGLPTGTVIVATEILTEHATYPALSECAARAKARAGPIFGGVDIVATVEEKAALAARTGAVAVDLESGPVARAAQAAGIPFIAIRAIADPAWDALPPAALLPLDHQGRPNLRRVLWSVLKNPKQVSALIKTGRDTKTALEALNRACRRLTRA
jgi:adenosylhomocysteine nucleosidase